MSLVSRRTLAAGDPAEICPTVFICGAEGGPIAPLDRMTYSRRAGVQETIMVVLSGNVSSFGGVWPVLANRHCMTRADVIDLLSILLAFGMAPMRQILPGRYNQPPGISTSPQLCCVFVVILVALSPSICRRPSRNCCTSTPRLSSRRGYLQSSSQVGTTTYTFQISSKLQASERRFVTTPQQKIRAVSRGHTWLCIPSNPRGSCSLQSFMQFQSKAMYCLVQDMTSSTLQTLIQDTTR